MSSERWQRIQEIFEQALERPASEQDAYVAEICGEDSTLRRAVETLLIADRQGEEFLEEPLMPAPVQASGPLPSGGQLGPYRLVRELGEGGMSTVYLAKRDDQAFQRRVAIKVIRRGMETVHTQMRLQVERQILAALDHPYVAKLYDGGTTDEGLPYFVMEYVQGRPIDAYCDQHRLTVAERCELFRKVCSAVHYAHQNLIVHRDIKPSNILVTADGSPKLLDFGIAKLLNPELAPASVEATATWMRLLTPGYASPEQVRGEPISTASDTYSLGVLLFKLLTNRLPYKFDGKTPSQIERLLEEHDPPKPSTAITTASEAKDSEPTEELSPTAVARARSVKPDQLHRILDGDLDKIVLMALRSVPSRRYGSVEQLSEDLRRHLMGFPVIARQGNVVYRWRKFVLRNRWPLAAAATSLLLVVAFAVATMLQSARVAHERDQARQDRDQKKQVLALVEEIFRLADPGEARGETFTVREALERSAGLVGGRLESQPAMEVAVRKTIGKIYFNLGLYEEARNHLGEALALRRQIYGEQSMEVVETLGAVGAADREIGDYDLAESHIEEAVTIARTLVGDDHPGLVEPLNQLVTLRCYERAYEEARQPSQEALTLARRYLDDTQSAMAEAINNRALVLKQDGRLEEAEALYREGLAIQRRILGEDHPEVANVLNNLAVILKTLGEHASAEQAHRETLALRRKLYGDTHPAVAQSLTNLASTLRAQEIYEKAEINYREALEILREQLGPSHPLTIQVAITLGSMLLDSGRPEDAESWLLTCLDIWRQELPTEHALIPWAENALGHALSELGRDAEALEILESSLARLEAHHGADHTKTRRALERLIGHHDGRGETEAAARYRSRLPTTD